MERVLLITGASSEIGVSLIWNQIDCFDYIIAHYCSNKKSLEELQEKYSSKILLLQADLSLVDDTQRFISTILELGKIPSHIVHLAALPCQLNKFHKIKWNDFEKNMQVCLGSCVLILQKILPYMVKNKYGKIVFMLTINTLGEIYKYVSDYVTVKYSLLGLMEALSEEYRDYGIRINGISPDMIDTKFISKIPDLVIEGQRNKQGGVLLSVDDIIPTVDYLLSTESDELYGQNIRIKK